MSLNVRVDMKGGGYRFLVASTDIRKDEEIIQVSGIPCASPCMHSMHTSLDEHTYIDNISKYISHECFTPNAYFDYTRKPWLLRAARDIKVNEPITYDYAQTEFKMASVFNCECGNSLCRKEIKGFYFMSRNEKEKLISLGHVSPVVMALYKSSETSK